MDQAWGCLALPAALSPLGTRPQTPHLLSQDGFFPWSVPGACIRLPAEDAEAAGTLRPSVREGPSFRM